MRELPILFQTDMVQANLAGRKTMTRRLLKSMSKKFKAECWEIRQVDGKFYEAIIGAEQHFPSEIKCPYGKVGNVLWVRESFCMPDDEYFYKADGMEKSEHYLWDGKWKPSIYMPKEAARIWLKVLSVKAERAQDISEADAVREGVEFLFTEHVSGYKYYLGNPAQINLLDSAKDSFRSLWISINGQESWDANPWVWAIEYKILSTTGKPANLCE
jgi:hypothetical protein